MRPIKQNKRVPAFANSGAEEFNKGSETRISEPPPVPTIRADNPEGEEVVAEEGAVSPMQELVATLQPQEKEELFNLLKAEMEVAATPSIPMDDDDEVEGEV